jgi:hypothetical protein
MDANLVSTLIPIGEFLASLDISDTVAAKAALDAEFGPARMKPVSDAILAAHAAGTLTPRSAGPDVRFGRIAKPRETPTGHAIDAVDIAGAGAAHAHPEGEVSWCLPIEGAPVFEGASDGWVVLPPGSRHTPEVSGGRMVIVYFLPGGAIDWSG